MLDPQIKPLAVPSDSIIERELKSLGLQPERQEQNYPANNFLHLSVLDESMSLNYSQEIRKNHHPEAKEIVKDFGFSKIEVVFMKAEKRKRAGLGQVE